MSVEEENIFKKIPQVYELNNMLYSLISSWESKLNMDYIDDKLSKNEGNKEEIVYLNGTIREILRELSTSTTSQLLSGIQRYIKRPYSKELSDNIVSTNVEPDLGRPTIKIGKYFSKFKFFLFSFVKIIFLYFFGIIS